MQFGGRAGAKRALDRVTGIFDSGCGRRTSAPLWQFESTAHYCLTQHQNCSRGVGQFPHSDDGFGREIRLEEKRDVSGG